MKRRWLLVLPVLFAIVAVASSSSSKSNSVAVLSPEDEPGTRLVVAGRVFDESGTRGVPGVKLYAYHTDAKGIYGLIPGVPRLKGTVVSDSEGRFEWRTIRPMPYPSRGNPAHIHIEASGGDYPKQWIDDLWFSDDPYLTAEQRAASQKKGKFTPIVTTTRDAKGVLHATFNIRLSKNPSR